MVPRLQLSFAEEEEARCRARPAGEGVVLGSEVGTLPEAPQQSRNLGLPVLRKVLDKFQGVSPAKKRKVGEEGMQAVGEIGGEKVQRIASDLANRGFFVSSGIALGTGFDLVGYPRDPLEAHGNLLAYVQERKEMVSENGAEFLGRYRVAKSVNKSVIAAFVDGSKVKYQSFERLLGSEGEDEVGIEDLAGS